MRLRSLTRSRTRLASHRSLVPTLFEIVISGPLGRVIARLREVVYRHRDADEPVSPRPTRPPLVPNRITTQQLDGLVAVRMAGSPADGSRDEVGRESAVVWVDAGDELIVHLASLRARVVGDAVLFAVDVECDQTGRQTVVVPFALGSDASGGILLAAEDRPRGPEPIVGRWGASLQQALYASLVDLSELHAIERGGRPKALYVRDGALELVAEAG